MNLEESVALEIVSQERDFARKQLAQYVHEVAMSRAGVAMVEGIIEQKDTELRQLRTALEESQAECGQLKEQLPLLTAKERLEEGGMARRFESTFGYPPTKEDLERIIAQTDAELEAQKEHG